MASLISTAAPGLVFATGAVVISAAILLATRKRWSHATPLTRCVALSVWIHLVLLGVASLTNWWTPAPSRGAGQAVSVAWVDADAFPESSEQQEADAEATSSPDADATPLPEERSLEAAPVEAADDASSNEIPAEPRSLLQAVDSNDTTAARESLSTPVDLPPDDASKQPEATGDTKPSPVPAALMSSVDLAARGAVEAPALLPVESEAKTPAREDGLSDQEAADLLAETQTPPAGPELRANEQREDSPAASTLLSTVPSAASPENAARLWKGVANASSLPPAYQGRSAEQRQQLLANGGGSEETEAAVRSALQWLAKAQNPKTGGWDTLAWGGGREVRDFVASGDSVQADTAVTGLALLAFLGAGHTAKEGQYQQTVQRGVEFLLLNQSPRTGSLAGRSARYAAMYSHGIATFALGEATVMSGDARLREPLRRAIGFTIASQHPVTGGWRYEAGDQGDTSQFGWQVMALVSARTAGVEAPPETWRRAELWLSRVALGSHGGLACYVPDQPRATPSMTAEAAVGHLFLRGGMQPDAQREATQMIARHPPDWSGQLDLYYTYYATLALYLSQDATWPTWNQQVIRELLPRQRSQGPLAGSWDTDSRWGSVGGRVYTTSLACLCLESYYRYLPSYQLARSSGQQPGWTSRRRQ